MMNMYERNMTPELQLHREVVHKILTMKEQDRIPSIRGAIIRFLDWVRDQDGSVTEDVQRVCRNLMKGCE